MPLEEYRKKRDFRATSEPAGADHGRASGRLFVIHKHAARRLHYDLRLELDGKLLSWAVPEGPCLDPARKRLAVHVEDHPIEYGDFEGIIPAGEYGGGTVMLWDRGFWEPDGDPHQGYRSGKLKFTLHGAKLRGSWALVRMGKKASDSENNWLLIKHSDAEARTEDRYSVLDEEPFSVLSGRGMKEIAGDQDTVWRDGRAVIEARRAAVRQSKQVPSPPELDPSGLPQARPGEPPASLEPPVAVAAKVVPGAPDWLHEAALDGRRLLCHLHPAGVTLRDVQGAEWTSRLPEIARDVSGFPVDGAVLDGVVTVLDSRGVSDVLGLERALLNHNTGGITYYVFDIPYCAGYDLRQTPLKERKVLLKSIMQHGSPGSRVRYSDHIEGNGPTVYEHARRLGGLGLVSKRMDSPYGRGRTRAWRRVACPRQGLFVVAGYTTPSHAPGRMRSLILGSYVKNTMWYRGTVSKGLSTEVRRALSARLQPSRLNRPSLPEPPDISAVQWVEPAVVVDVSFAGWTADGLLDEPAVVDLRSGADPTTATTHPPAEEATQSGPGSGTTAPDVVVEPGLFMHGVRLTHPERILYAEQRITKHRLAIFYEQVAEHILPHVCKRPLSLYRCPKGCERPGFFQKHLHEVSAAHVRGVVASDKPDKEPYVAIDGLAGLLTFVQWNVLEIHPWACREDRVERPDRLIFDLDPGPEVSWEWLAEAALELRDVLAGLELTAFVKTSGGKGLHVILPIRRTVGWSQLKEFAAAVTREMVRRRPHRYVATQTKSVRVGKIFLDYFRNIRGATCVAVYSTRALPAAPVSTPLHWDELVGQQPVYTVDSLPRRLALLSTDPWAGFLETRQSITKASMSRLRALSRQAS